MFKIYTSHKDREFDYYIVDNKITIEIEAILLFLLSFGLFAILNFNYLCILFILLFGLNTIVVFRQIIKSQDNIKHQSITYKMQDAMNHLFFKINILHNVMSKNGKSEEEINVVEKEYVNKIKINKNMVVLELISNTIDDDFYKIASITMPTPLEKDYNLFVKKEVDKYYEKFYPLFKDEVLNGQFTLKPRKGEEISKNDNDYLLGNALKKLGLPNTITDLKIIKKRYFDLIHMYHPDHNNNSMLTEEEQQNKMCEINEAYDYIKKVLDK